MTKQHMNLTGSSLHEPKGVATAAAGTVYKANGSGSGVWTDIVADINNANYVVYTAVINDISTAGSTFVVNPIGGVVSKLYTVIDGAIATANTTLSFEIAGTAITTGDITIGYSGSAAGDTDASVPTGNNSISTGQALEIISDGASSNTVKCTVTIVVDVS